MPLRASEIAKANMLAERAREASRTAGSPRWLTPERQKAIASSMATFASAAAATEAVVTKQQQAIASSLGAFVGTYQKSVGSLVGNYEKSIGASLATFASAAAAREAVVAKQQQAIASSLGAFVGTYQKSVGALVGNYEKSIGASLATFASAAAAREAVAGETFVRGVSSLLADYLKQDDVRSSEPRVGAGLAKHTGPDQGAVDLTQSFDWVTVFRWWNGLALAEQLGAWAATSIAGHLMFYVMAAVTKTGDAFDPTGSVVDHISDLYTNIMAACFLYIVGSYWTKKHRQ